MTQDSLHRRRHVSRRAKPALFDIIILLCLLLSSCSNGGGKGDNAYGASDSVSVEKHTESAYHADNDIAMTILSVTDAFRQGEMLDSTDYNFEGILTDGLGHPLYTDIQGAPGIWQVEVTSPESLSIRNLYLGDLLPEALESYVTQSLGLSESNLVDPATLMFTDGAAVSAYHFPGGILRFETRTALTPAGQEGPLMTISATADNS